MNWRLYLNDVVYPDIQALVKRLEKISQHIVEQKYDTDLSIAVANARGLENAIVNETIIPVPFKGSWIKDFHFYGFFSKTILFTDSGNLVLFKVEYSMFIKRPLKAGRYKITFKNKDWQGRPILSLVPVYEDEEDEKEATKTR